ncbi:hypothetical protein K491DRAFT_598475 [Lophiostoma macrostomum CBS 122681]|uniref:2EXR domain-containing protein n=1 Tax=Lophiostoma macrostomum CBS 122681 TaxID=1314788 RepID=A0A6A6T787_9PLEO|nr:hypothetical protein K491DRAFT_598475 [Lophiostoma macrostomum CBS 122681]
MSISRHNIPTPSNLLSSLSLPPTKAMTTPQTFSHFTSLPAELRNQIWRDTLPARIGHGLYPYRKGCICPRWLTPDDLDYYAPDPENNLTIEFRGRGLGLAEFGGTGVKLWGVCREARSIALGWVREVGIGVRTSTKMKTPRPPLFLKAFDAQRDTVYVPEDQWETFICEPLERAFEPDMVGQSHSVGGRLVQSVAVPVALLKRYGSDLATEMLDMQCDLREVLVVLGEGPDWGKQDGGERVLPRWEYEDARQGKYVWNYTRKMFLLDAKYLSRSVRKDWFPRDVNEGMRLELERADVKSFEVRAVVAVRR